MSILERIKYDGVTNGEPWLIYKCKEEDIAYGSQLIVSTGQEAIFVKGGRAQDIFTSGTYTLESGNLPFLRKFLNMPFGGKTPFSAEIVFVNRTDNLNLKWGTSSPVTYEDPKYGLILDLRSFGRFGVQIFDSRLFFNRFIGSMRLDSGYNHNFIINQFLSTINTKYKTLLMRFLQEHHMSYFDLPACYEEISRLAKETLLNDFASYGIHLLNFMVESVTPPKDQYSRLRQYKEELSLGPDFYTKRRSFDILEGAANSSVGSMVGMGMGLGAGMYASSTAAGPVERLMSQVNISDPVQVQNNLTCPHCREVVKQGSVFCPHCGQPLKEQFHCPSCGKVVDKEARFCQFCGASLKRVCPACHAELEPGAKFCSKCGKKCDEC